MTITPRTYSDLEAIAESFLLKYGKVENRYLRIESTLSNFGYVVMPVTGLAAVAEAYIPVKAGFIFIDEDQYLGIEGPRYRFTLAEELAHLILHRPLFEGMTPDQVLIERANLTDGQYLQIEREAKDLAGCLLMPAGSFKARFVRFQAIQSGRTGNQLQTLRYIVRQLCYDFVVSGHAVSIRALKLGLIDQGQLDELRESWETKS